MSTAAQVFRGYAQGTDTASVLTNRSKYITIISDEPYFSRHLRAAPLSSIHRKGTRPMHGSTLTFEVCPVKTSYTSTIKQNFSGSKSLKPSRRPPAYPSQHTSQFSIGFTSDHLLKTRSRETYITHPVKPAAQYHEHNQRWNEQMAGQDMIQSTRHNNSKEIKFDTTYGIVHDSLGKQRGPGTQACPLRLPRYNILTGSEQPMQMGDFYRISGNRVLHSSRQHQQSLVQID